MKTSIQAIAEALLPGASGYSADGTTGAALSGVSRLAERMQPGRPFTEWTHAEQESFLGDVMADGSPAGSDLRAFLDHLAVQRYTSVSAWNEIGFVPAPPHHAPSVNPAAEDVATIRLSDAESHYDVVVVGSGAGGGVAAGVLTAAGLSVLLVERGQSFGTHDLPLDHARSARMHAGPARQVEIGVEATARIVDDEVVLPTTALWNGNASAVGGGTRVYGAMAWRLCPEDFAMATTYGAPQVDWPISYDDMAPYYDRVDNHLGVSGQVEPLEWDGPRTTSYPMPPLPPPVSSSALATGAAALGWQTGIPPMLINSVPRDGRPACIQCGTCVGFGCPVGAKNGTHNTMVRRAIGHGCDVVDRCVATRLVSDHDGAVRGVELAWGEHRRTITARHVVVSCGAIETARLLLASGIGVEHGQVGRYLQGHLYTGATALFDDEMEDCTGPGPSIGITRFRHHNNGIRGGGILARDFVPTPLEAHRKLVDAGLIPAFGAESVAALATAFRRSVYLVGPVHEVPQADSMVRLDPLLRDRHGMPLVRLTSPGQHLDDIAVGQFLAARAAEWAYASGARRVAEVSWGTGKGPSADQHQAGTCRMGTDPRTSVCDPMGRVWGHAGVTVADGSLHVTNGGVNPVLTIMALSWRVADGLTADLVRS